MTVEIEFQRVRETKGAVVYREVRGEIIGTLYVRKAAAPDGGWPETIKITVETK